MNYKLSIDGELIKIGIQARIYEGNYLDNAILAIASESNDALIEMYKSTRQANAFSDHARQYSKTLGFKLLIYMINESMIEQLLDALSKISISDISSDEFDFIVLTVFRDNPTLKYKLTKIISGNPAKIKIEQSELDMEIKNELKSYLIANTLVEDNINE